MNLQDIDISIIIGILILIFVVIGFIKGLIKILITILSLSISGYIAWLSFGYLQIIAYNESYIPTIASGIIWIIAFAFCIRILKFIINPFNSSKAGDKFGFGLPAALLSLLTIILTTFLSFTLIRYIGSIADLRNTKNFLEGTPTQARDKVIISIKKSLDSSKVGQWHATIDPINSKAKLSMAKIMLMYHDKPMRAKMLNAPVFDSIINNHLFLEIAYKDDLKNTVDAGKCNTLYNHPIIKEILKENLLRLDLETVEFFHKH